MMAIHDCGGTILVGGVGAERHTYCHRCGAFRYGEDVASLPTGTDPVANRAAWDAGEDASPEAEATPTVACECGKWTGERCVWSGPVGETVVVEYMPEHHRASHIAAGNAGIYPYNGAVRVRVHCDCAERLLADETERDWSRIVGR